MLSGSHESGYEECLGKISRTIQSDHRAPFISRAIIKPGKYPKADVTCTGALWATSDQNDQRVNLVKWAEEIDHLIDEHGAWRILGQGRNAPNRSEFGQAPPPLVEVQSVQPNGRGMDIDGWNSRVRANPSSMALLLSYVFNGAKEGVHMTNGTAQLVDLSIKTQVPHMTQHISVPLSQIEVSEDVCRYTRDPERPLQRQRLMLVIDSKRPSISY